MTSQRQRKDETYTKYKVVAIDGPAGAGKSTVSRLLAKKLGYLYIDTGAMYRAITLKALNNRVSPQDEPVLIELSKTISIELKNEADGSLKVILDGKDVSTEIRQSFITRVVSDISRIKGVRTSLLEKQRAFAKTNNVVLDGRDIGTVVFPDADYKFYIDADFNERVKRRYKELKEMGQTVSEEEVKSDVKNRDRIDSTRKVAPLKKADDASYIDTTNMTIEEVVNRLLEEIRRDE
ncbi:MAG: (d)CMP kinase [Candidatus Omnitrophota bacterium]